MASHFTQSKNAKFLKRHRRPCKFDPGLPYLFWDFLSDSSPFSFDSYSALQPHGPPLLPTCQKGCRMYPPPTKHDRICQPIIYCIGILSCRHLKNSECRKRLSLNLPYVPRDRSSKKSSLIKNPLLGRFITGVETTGQHYSQRSFVTNSRTSHLSFSKIPFTFPKNQWLSPKKSIFPLSFPY